MLSGLNENTQDFNNGKIYKHSLQLSRLYVPVVLCLQKFSVIIFGKYYCIHFHNKNIVIFIVTKYPMIFCYKYPSHKDTDVEMEPSHWNTWFRGYVMSIFRKISIFPSGSHYNKALEMIFLQKNFILAHGVTVMMMMMSHCFSASEKFVEGKTGGTCYRKHVLFMDRS